MNEHDERELTLADLASVWGGRYVEGQESASKLWTQVHAGSAEERQVALRELGDIFVRSVATNPRS